jgi:uncharacterized protein YodC (DUF2158 family)
MSKLFVIETACDKLTRGYIYDSLSKIGFLLGQVVKIEELDLPPDLSDINQLQKEHVIEFLNGRKLNLRRDKSPTFEIGQECKVKNLNGPKMIVIDNTKDDFISCGYYTPDGFWASLNFRKELLEEIREEEKPNLHDVQMFGFSMNQIVKDFPIIRSYIMSNEKIMAIKKVREITNLGLKEAKDFVEAVSIEMIKQWSAQ